MDNIKYVLRRIKRESKQERLLGTDPKGRSWGMQEGILVSIEEAEQIVSYIKKLEKQDSVKR